MRLFAIVLGIVLAACALPDGKLFPSRNTTLEQPGIRHQRALIAWNDGEQAMIVENTVASPDGSAWILPMPGKPTRVEMLPEGYFQILENLLRPHVTGGSFALGPLLFTLVFILLGLAWARNEEKPKGLLFNAFAAGALGFLIAAIFFPVFASTGGAHSTFGFARVGDYEIATIAPEQAEDAAAWLNENGFSISAAESNTLEEYAKNGWHFVAAKLPPDASRRLKPLLIQCASPKAVYPMTLTGLQGGKLNLELYVVGPEEAAVPDMALVSSRSFEGDPDAIFSSPGGRMTRLVGSFDLSPSTKDLEPQWNDSPGSRLHFYTPAGKKLAIGERAASSICIALLFVPALLLRRQGFLKAVASGVGVGLAAGLIWSMPLMGAREIGQHPSRADSRRMALESRRSWDRAHEWLSKQTDVESNNRLRYEDGVDEGAWRGEVGPDEVRIIAVNASGSISIASEEIPVHRRPKPAR